MSKGLVVALSGGVGGAKLALGLSRVLPADELLVVANTGDDFEHLGLQISPDIDTLTYMLAGLDNPSTAGAGATRPGPSWRRSAALGGADWFRLGDRDLAMHVERTRRLQRRRDAVADHGRHLPPPWHRAAHPADERRSASARVCGPTRAGSTSRTISCASNAGRSCASLRSTAPQGARRSPMSSRRCGGEGARRRDLPSNPFISIEPILAVPGMRDALEGCGAPVVAVSPIIGGKAVKGPTAKMMQELGLAVTSAAVAERYGDLLDGYIVDEGDAAGVPGKVHVAPTLMTSVVDQGSAGAHRPLLCGFSS